MSHTGVKNLEFEFRSQIIYTVDSRYKPTPRDREKGGLITVGGLISDYFIKRIWLKGPAQGWAYNRCGLISRWAYNESRLYFVLSLLLSRPV